MLSKSIDNNPGIDDINYYRPIAIFTIVRNLFESCIYEHICNLLRTCIKHLGFVRGGGCSRAIVTVKSVINCFCK